MLDINYLLPHLLFKTVLSYPNKIALYADDQDYTYQLLYEDISRLTDYMKILELSRGDRVIIQAGNSYMTIVSFWATLLCEAVPCVIDHDLTGACLKKLIKSISPKINVGYFISDVQFEIYVSSSIPLINELCERIVTPCSFDCFVLKNTETDIAMMLHTSGSTEDPKCVMFSHRNVLAAVQSIVTSLNLCRLDTIFSFIPLHFDYGLYQMLLTMALGGTLVLEKNTSFMRRAAKKIARYNATVIPCVPSLIQLFYDAAVNHAYDFLSVRIVINIDDSLSNANIEKLKKLFTSAKIYSMYGLTECKRCSYIPPEMLDKKSESIGISMPNLEMWVQNEYGHVVGPNIEGDLVISGPTVMLGYWDNPSATNERIKIHASGKRLLMTGDRVFMDDEGYFYFKRIKNQAIQYNELRF